MDEHSSARVRRHVISSVVTTAAVVIGLLLMSLADGAPFNFVRPEHVVDLGAGAVPNHQGDGNALTPETLARRAATAVTAAEVAPATTARATTPTTAMLIAELVASKTPNPPTTPPTTAAPVVDPRDGSGFGDRDIDGVRTAHRAHIPHIPHVPQLDVHIEHVKHVAHPPHRKHVAHVRHVAHPKRSPFRGRRSSTSSCA